METIDFTHLPRRNKMYAGANGKKICVVYEGELYMLKFPATAKQNKNMSYANSSFSEHIGCRIYESIGLPAQKTILGTIKINGREKIAVACGDFTEPGIVLQDFASLKNQVINSERNGYGTELSDILFTLEEQTAVDPVLLIQRFWDMFIVDSFIGNWDRHNGNWGFLYDTRTDTIALAPVYDCGSSLYSQADDAIMESVLTRKGDFKYRIYEIPTSAIMVNGKRIKYFDFISSLQNEYCNQALMRIVPKINMARIQNIIEETPFLSDLQRRFYMTMLTERKRLILDYSMLALEKRNSQMEQMEEKPRVRDTLKAAAELVKNQSAPGRGGRGGDAR